MTTGDRIRMRREELNLSQEELAKRLGNKSRASVSTVENNKEDMTLDRVARYAKALGVTPAYLMGWEHPAGDMIIQNMEPKKNTITIELSGGEKEAHERLYKICSAYLAASPDTQKAIDAILHIGDTDGHR